jgi:two-component system sensor histidine kinase KdpD
VQRDEARARRGRLKIFFGANAGVGKTYAMLSAPARTRRKAPVTCVGVVETHGRSETPKHGAGLPRLPLARGCATDGRTLREFDLDAALALRTERSPRPVCWWTNWPTATPEGSRHPKRWQDVEELLQRRH